MFVFSDSKAAIGAIASSKLIFNPHCLDILNLVSCLASAGTKGVLVWIPRHAGIIGNEKADFLASEESRSPSRNIICNRLTVDENISSFKSNWNSEILAKFKEGNADPILRASDRTTVSFRPRLGLADWQFCINRRACIILHKLRSGHNRLNEFINRKIDELHDRVNGK